MLNEMDDMDDKEERFDPLLAKICENCTLLSIKEMNEII